MTSFETQVNEACDSVIQGDVCVYIAAKYRYYSFIIGMYDCGSFSFVVWTKHF